VTRKHLRALPGPRQGKRSTTRERAQSVDFVEGVARVDRRIEPRRMINRRRAGPAIGIRSGVAAFHHRADRPAGFFDITTLTSRGVSMRPTILFRTFLGCTSSGAYASTSLLAFKLTTMPSDQRRGQHRSTT